MSMRRIVQQVYPIAMEHSTHRYGHGMRLQNYAHPKERIGIVKLLGWDKDTKEARYEVDLVDGNKANWRDADVYPVSESAE
jgi:hypothetical protein